MTQLDRIESLLTQLTERADRLEAELDDYRPLLNTFKPRAGAGALVQAGMARAARKAARNHAQ